MARIPYRNGASLDALLDLPASDGKAPQAILVLAHGSSAKGKDHPLLAGLAEALAANGIACLRFDFPFVAQKKATPNSDAVLDDAFAHAIYAACAHFPESILVAAGKSLGARAAARVTNALARQTRNLPDGARAPDGALFLTYPLHPAGRTGFSPDTPAICCPRPMLFIQGTRDPLANSASLREFVALLPRAGLRFVEGGDHALRGCRDPAAALAECAQEITRWISSLPLITRESK